MVQGEDQGDWAVDKEQERYHGLNIDDKLLWVNWLNLMQLFVVPHVLVYLVGAPQKLTDRE